MKEFLVVVLGLEVGFRPPFDIPGRGMRQIFVSGPEGAMIELQCPEATF